MGWTMQVSVVSREAEGGGGGGGGGAEMVSASGEAKRANLVH